MGNILNEVPSHLWPSTFNSFSKLPNTVGSILYSEPFAVGIHKFKIRLYPGGVTQDDKDWVSIFLELCEPTTPVLVKYRLSILDLSGNKKVLKGQDNSEFSPGTSSYRCYGYDHFVKSTDLSNEVLAHTNDQLIVLCEIYNISDPESVHQSCQRSCSFKRFLNNEECSDIKVIVNNEIIHAHKVILMSSSDVLAAMFEHDTIESKENIIKIDDIEKDVMIELMRFIYTGQVCNMERIVEELLVAADKYAIDDLKVKCSKYLCRVLSYENVLRLMSFANHYNVHDLLEQAFDFFITHKKNVVRIHNFEDMLDNVESKLVARIIIALSDP
ncbi:hypothetical protein QAD02_016535 [Eretmocerus hayati]|uniref:Uncharacterized protein n=1 Tax=Eretmocerus hayati TaxID=131215 RepID=A0ACC2PCE2_9HYME|nr:hypothetical protein QAD02_016535 [Eretmocerus hayati]